MNLFEKTKGKGVVVSDGWYDPDSVAGRFVRELERELFARGFAFASSGTCSTTAVGVHVSGRFGDYRYEDGPVGAESVRISDMGATRKGTLVVHYEAAAKSGGDRRVWTHTGKTTDIYTGNRKPSGQYDPGVSARSVIIQLVGLEARLRA
ncbi:hypothetical protein HYU17_01265 [Candidatus Woesearchaeota archaeon]|nr:hypothetical protein [Candidatus Woesearchaeota archaeon]